MGAMAIRRTATKTERSSAMREPRIRQISQRVPTASMPGSLIQKWNGRCVNSDTRSRKLRM